ncbi:diaminopimelate decarboxylase family protein, partial [Klebsiella pneumoniae]|uniref:diaminopimelate decarboxylase family protein n=1 Tax=Klebsiella pneumoniae TaxID=573 RepID=UPI003B45D6A2|nr:diaminopimelate decarboxylase [Klebsiella pneumoniae]
KENKFGIAIGAALDAYRSARLLPGLEITGLDCHIGSQLTDISPYFDALEKLLDLVDDLDGIGIRLSHLDLGGGLGIRYRDEVPPSPKALLDHVFQRLQARGQGHLQLVLEPGRSLVGNAGVLLPTVQYLKHGEARNFAIVDAA